MMLGVEVGPFTFDSVKRRCMSHLSSEKASEFSSLRKSSSDGSFMN